MARKRRLFHHLGEPHRGRLHVGRVFGYTCSSATRGSRGGQDAMRTPYPVDAMSGVRAKPSESPILGTGRSQVTPRNGHAARGACLFRSFAIVAAMAHVACASTVDIHCIGPDATDPPHDPGPGPFEGVWLGDVRDERPGSNVGTRVTIGTDFCGGVQVRMVATARAFPCSRLASALRLGESAVFEPGRVMQCSPPYPEYRDTLQRGTLTISGDIVTAEWDELRDNPDEPHLVVHYTFVGRRQ